jgi:alanine dehydrogenase
MDLFFFSPNSPLNCASQEDPTYLTSDVLHYFMTNNSLSTESKASTSPSYIELNVLIVYQI